MIETNQDQGSVAFVGLTNPETTLPNFQYKIKFCDKLKYSAHGGKKLSSGWDYVNSGVRSGTEPRLQSYRVKPSVMAAFYFYW